MADEIREECQNCRFWRQFLKPDDTHHGDCRRYPPSGDEPDQYTFPVTPFAQWCGEWQPVSLPKENE